MNTWQSLLYGIAALLPLVAFAIAVIFGRQLRRFNAYLATGAIGLSFFLSLIGFIDYFGFEAPWLSNAARYVATDSRSSAGESGAVAAMIRTPPTAWRHQHRLDQTRGYSCSDRQPR